MMIVKILPSKKTLFFFDMIEKYIEILYDIHFLELSKTPNVNINTIKQLRELYTDGILTSLKSIYPEVFQRIKRKSPPDKRFYEILNHPLLKIYYIFNNVITLSEGNSIYAPHGYLYFQGFVEDKQVYEAFILEGKTVHLFYTMYSSSSQKQK